MLSPLNPLIGGMNVFPSGHYFPPFISSGIRIGPKLRRILQHSPVMHTSNVLHVQESVQYVTALQL